MKAKVCYEDEIADCVGMMQAQKPAILSCTYCKVRQALWSVRNRITIPIKRVIIGIGYLTW